MFSRVQIPSPNIYYRIQSVSLVSYLDLHDIDDYNVFLRPLHDDNEQKWLFIRDLYAGGSGFKVMNAATEHLRNKRYLSLHLNNRTGAYASTDRDSPRPAIWNVTREQEEEGIFSFTCDEDNDEIFLSVDPHKGQTALEVKRLSNTTILSRNMKWRILEVTPSIPKDIYRIRGWLGRALHMTSQSKVVSLVPLKKKQHEEWEVEPLGNGRCTIKSVAAGSYLGWEMGNDSTTKVMKTDLPREWIVKSINLNGYTYSITTSDKPPYETEDLALTNGDTSELYMKPIKVTQNQVWFFEPVNVSTYASPVRPPSLDTIGRYADVTERLRVPFIGIVCVAIFMALILLHNAFCSC